MFVLVLGTWNWSSVMVSQEISKVIEFCTAKLCFIMFYFYRLNNQREICLCNKYISKCQCDILFLIEKCCLTLIKSLFIYHLSCYVTWLKTPASLKRLKKYATSVRYEWLDVFYLRLITILSINLLNCHVTMTQSGKSIDSNGYLGR